MEEDLNFFKNGRQPPLPMNNAFPNLTEGWLTLLRFFVTTLSISCLRVIREIGFPKYGFTFHDFERLNSAGIK